MRKEENNTIKFERYKEQDKQSGKKNAGLLKMNLYDFIDSVKYALIAISVIFLVFFRVFSVNGVSMVPTLHDGDKVVVSSLAGKIEKEDIVVVGKTPTFSESIVKRVIATGGDKVDINFSTGKVYVNEVELVEYNNSLTQRQYDVPFPLTVPEGSVFLLGDNRNDSLDSRSTLIGCVDERHIIGKVLFKLDFGNWKVE